MAPKTRLEPGSGSPQRSPEDAPAAPLRSGWSTGACATAATRAAYTALLTGTFPDPVTIRLPRGETPRFPLAHSHLGEGYARAGITKDAGDDPDVTHGALVLARVRRRPSGSGLRFAAGPGVGTVTRRGLQLAVGEPAINLAPRRMMADVVRDVAAAHGADGAVEIEIAIPGGELLAQRTANGRLGIRGGLSVLGTTGVVRPFSCSAWIDSIRRGIDVARASGVEHLAAATGSRSEQAVQRRYDLPEVALIEMGDFAGAVLKYLRRHPVPRLSLAGGFAKLSKLAAGALDLHSRAGAADTGWLARQVETLGAPPATVERLRRAHSAARALELATAEGLPLAQAVAVAARGRAASLVGSRVAVEVLIFDADGHCSAVAPP